MYHPNATEYYRLSGGKSSENEDLGHDDRDFYSVIRPMDIKEVLAKRMQDLGYSNYKIAQLISQRRAQDGGTASPATRYSSSVARTLSEPERAKFETLEELIKVLDGEIIIRWNNPEEVKLK